MEKLVFLHGWVSKYVVDKSDKVENFYQELLFYLSKKFEIYFVTLPGFNGNPEPNHPFTLNDYVNYVKNYVEEKGINKFYLMGHSFGGQVACKFTYLYPEKVEKLILYNAACIRRKNLKRLFFNFFSKLFKKISNNNLFLKKIIYKILTGSSLVAYYSEVMKQTMSNIINEDLFDILKNIKNETIIIWGKKDKLTPLWQGKLIHSLISNSKLIIHPEGHHNFHKFYPQFILDNIN